MSTQSDTAQDTSNSEGNLPDNSTPTKTNNDTKSTDTNQQPQSKDVVLKKDVDALLAKVRQEEKSKLYPEIEKLKNKSIELESMNKSLAEKIEERQKEVEALRAGKLGELDSVNKELNNLRETNKQLSVAIENVATEAAAKIRQSELASYREKRIRESGLKAFHDMVSGNNEEEIEEAIKKVAEKENTIFEKAREEALAQLAKDLPKPIAPDGSQGRNLVSNMNPQKRAQIVGLKDNSEYAKLREELMTEAKRKAGM